MMPETSEKDFLCINYLSFSSICLHNLLFIPLTSIFPMSRNNFEMVSQCTKMEKNVGLIYAFWYLDCTSVDLIYHLIDRGFWKESD